MARERRRVLRRWRRHHQQCQPGVDLAGVGRRVRSITAVQRLTGRSGGRVLTGQSDAGDRSGVRVQDRARRRRQQRDIVHQLSERSDADCLHAGRNDVGRQRLGLHVDLERHQRHAGPPDHVSERSGRGARRDARRDARGERRERGSTVRRSTSVGLPTAPRPGASPGSVASPRCPIRRPVCSPAGASTPRYICGTRTGRPCAQFRAAPSHRSVRSLAMAHLWWCRGTASTS